MTCTNCPPIVEEYGASPKNVKWNIVRGDTSSIRIEFWEDDEVTGIDTTGWEYVSTAYNPANDTSYTLTTTPANNYVDIIATPLQTAAWGTGFKSVVNELSFDLEVTTGTTVWTPVVGTICVLGDVTTGGSL